MPKFTAQAIRTAMVAINYMNLSVQWRNREKYFQATKEIQASYNNYPVLFPMIIISF